MNDRLTRAAQLYDEAAEQLDLAAQHCRTAAQHFRDRLVPRGAAHAWAAHGHVREAQQRLDEQSREHARSSNPSPD
jgi:hypothetical protein